VRAKPQRRKTDITPDEVEEFFGSLPQTIDDLKTGRRQNRALALAVASIALLGGYFIDRQQDALEDSQRMDRVRAVAICKDLTDNARRFNVLIDTLITRTKRSPIIPASDKAEAVRLYTSAKQTLPVCVPPLEDE
jgi:hypothetical protein